MADATVLWEACATAIQSKVSDVIWQMTFSGAKPITADGLTLTVSVPNSLIRDRINDRYHDLVHNTVAEVSDDQLTLKIIVRQDETDDPDDFVIPLTPSSNFDLIAQDPATNKTPKQPTATTTIQTPTENGGPSFSGRLTFEDFVIGSSNRFAHAAAQAVAEKPGQSYNPLYLHSGSGLGKTHLLQAIGKRCASQGMSVLYVTSEQFTNEFISAIRNRTTEDFRHRYRSVQVLLLDDVQFLSGKEQTHEGFFHTFNDLHNSGNQVVISSDRAPKDLTAIRYD